MASEQTQITFVQEKLYTVEEAAAYLHVCVSTVYNLTSQRRIRFIKTGKQILFRREFLDEYMDSRTFDIIPAQFEVMDNAR
jgi:excisionase family DNA binding protein